MTAALGRPGSPVRVLWLYLSSTAAMWVLWTLAALAVGFGTDHSTDEFWGLAVYVWYVVGTVAMIVVNALVWFTAGWLIDAKARRKSLWYLAIGVVLGAWVAIGLRDGNPYALIAGLVIAIGGFVIGPAVAERAFVSRSWRIAVGLVMVLLVLAVLGVLL